MLLAVVLQKAWAQAFDLVLHSLENAAFNRTLHVLIAIALYLILLESTQFYSTWLALKRLLLALDRFPLRRTFEAMQGLSMRSLWRLSGSSSRARYKIFAHQLGSLLHLRNELDAPEWLNCGTLALRQSVRKTWDAGTDFVEKRSAGKDFAMVNDKEPRRSGSFSVSALKSSSQTCCYPPGNRNAGFGRYPGIAAGRRWTHWRLRIHPA